MSSYSPREFVGLLQTWFQGNLVARYFFLNADEPTEYYLGIQSLKTIQKHPAIYIIGPSSQIEPALPMGFKAAGIATTADYHKTRVEVAVGVIDVHQDGETLQQLLYEHAEGVIETIFDGFAQGGFNDWQIVEDIPWEINYETARFREAADAEQWIGEMSITLFAWRMEGQSL